MVNAFAKLTFTPAVLDFQTNQGSLRAYSSLLDDEADPADRIGPNEAAFVSARDGFYQATVSENGWPYVQFRGGPAGFLKVIDDKKLAYADFRGNRQYLSAGNLTANDRIAMILVDYPNSRRLKVWGRAELIDKDDDPKLIAALNDSSYRAKPERAVIISIEALAWNCPQHLPKRFTIQELNQHLAPIAAELENLKAQNAKLHAQLAEHTNNDT